MSARTSGERAAAVLIATLPGATLWHEGQFTGRRTRLPAFLDRRPDEPPDAELRAFHERLLAAVHRSGMRGGRWRLLECAGRPDNATHRNLVASGWVGPAGRFVTVVNLELQGEISGLSRSVSNLGSSVGTALAGTVLVADPAFGAYAAAMIVLGVIGLGGLGAATLLPRGKGVPRPHGELAVSTLVRTQQRARDMEPVPARVQS